MHLLCSQHFANGSDNLGSHFSVNTMRLHVWQRSAWIRAEHRYNCSTHADLPLKHIVVILEPKTLLSPRFVCNSSVRPRRRCGPGPVLLHEAQPYHRQIVQYFTIPLAHRWPTRPLFISFMIQVGAFVSISLKPNSFLENVTLPATQASRWQPQ